MAKTKTKSASKTKCAQTSARAACLLPRRQRAGVHAGPRAPHNDSCQPLGFAHHVRREPKVWCSQSRPPPYDNWSLAWTILAEVLGLCIPGSMECSSDYVAVPLWQGPSMWQAPSMWQTPAMWQASAFADGSTIPYILRDNLPELMMDSDEAR